VPKLKNRWFRVFWVITLHIQKQNSPSKFCYKTADFHVLSSDSVTASDTTVGVINVTRFAGVVIFYF
jgi:hypothetical protein